MHIKRAIIASVLGFGLVLVLLLLPRGHLSTSALSPVAPNVVRVAPAPTGADTPGCGGLLSPCRSVQYAVDQAASGDEIRIATGVYTDVQTRTTLSSSTLVVTQVVAITKSLTLRGGYNPPNWISSAPKAYPTTLDAQGRGRGIYITGDISPTVEGLRVTGGRAFGIADVGYGGGIYVVTATATISGCQVVSNAANLGGGVSLLNSDAILKGNTAESNTANAQGGGLSLVESAATLTGNTLLNNNADNGGGLYLSNSPAVLSSNVITNNTANSQGGGLHSRWSDPILSNNVFSGNEAISSRGGGLFLYSGDAILSGNTIVNNTAGDDGGGLYLIFSDSTLDNNLIVGNRTSGNGAGVCIWSSAPRLRHTTLVDNSGGDGSGLYVTHFVSPSSTVTLTNTILVSHTVGLTVTAGNTVTLEATLWGTATWANATDWGGAGVILTGTVNLWDDPAFVAGPGDGDYHITGASAALDAGVDAGVTTDIDGERRPFGLGFDVGADELPIVWVHPLVSRTFVYTDVRGHPTTLYVPAGAVADTMLIAFTPVETITSPPGLAFGDHAFQLEAYRDRALLPDFFFRPGTVATLTIQYAQDEVRDIIESTLALYREGVTGWKKIGDDTVLPGEGQTLDTANNLLTARLFGFSKFGTMGTGINQRIYLPLVFKSD